MALKNNDICCIVEVTDYSNNPANKSQDKAVRKRYKYQNKYVKGSL